MLRVAVVGAGWAGLSAAIEATTKGHSVTLFEMASHCGGRARGVDVNGQMLDNGQHIMIGAYAECLRLMTLVGADPSQLWLRTPLAVLQADGTGLRLGQGHPIVAFAMAVAMHPTWRWPAKLALALAAMRWGAAGFRCKPSLSVAELTRSLPQELVRDLIDPLCIAALNTPSNEASASVFLRVLRDALFSAAGSADLLLPRVPLNELLPDPALVWLEQRRASLRLSTRVTTIELKPGVWSIDGQDFEHVVIATPASEAARLVMPIAPEWAGITRALRFEPIITVYLQSAGTRLPAPMLALRSDAARPAQFVFDRGQLGGPTGLLAFVISGAQPWVDRGIGIAIESTVAQAHELIGPLLCGPLTPVQTLTEKRATFRCTPGLRRPPPEIAPGLWAAGDYIDGPYPATLEGAVRSGSWAAIGATATHQH